MAPLIGWSDPAFPDMGPVNQQVTGLWHMGPGNSIQPWRALYDPVGEMPVYLHDKAGEYETPLGYVLPSEADKALVRRLKRNYPLLKPKTKVAAIIAEAYFTIKNLAMEEENVPHKGKVDFEKPQEKVSDLIQHIGQMEVESAQQPGGAKLAEAIAMARTVASIVKPNKRKRTFTRSRRFSYRRPRTIVRKVYIPSYRRRTYRRRYSRYRRY